MKDFTVNDFITLKLEKGKTNIYVDNKLFRQCKYLLLNIPIEKIWVIDELESIDEVAEKLDKSQEPFEDKEGIIPLETEFWGHCSNLQIWAENNYNTRLLHSNLSFPLLKKLTEVGDPIAKKRFKEEIITRYEEGGESVRKFLYNEEFLSLLSQEELITGLLQPIEANIMMKIISLSQTQYKMVRYFDEDEVRERLFLNTLYFSVEDGYIKQLELDLNQFSYSVPKFLSECKKLMKLILFIGCYHKAKINFYKLESISYLKFKINGNAILPNDFQNFPNLYTLCIYGNNGTIFENFPDTIGLLKNLNWLDIRSIPLKKFPFTITNLKNLENLILQDTNLEELSDSIINLTSLVMLDLDGNPKLKKTKIYNNIRKIVEKNKKKKYKVTS